MVAPPTLRVVFFGTPEFAVPALDALLHSRHRVVGVVTQPDRPRDRGQRIVEAPIKRCAQEASVPILQPKRLKDVAFVTSLVELQADLGVVVAYGRILTDEMLRTPRLGMINVHASLLPRYRGAAPIQRAIIDGERETGVTIMRVLETLDAGPILAAARRPIGSAESSEEVERDLATLGATLLVSIVDALAEGPVAETPQDEAGVTLAPRLTKDEGVIEWAHTAIRIHNLVRALQPWPHAYTRRKSERLIILRTEPAADSEDVPPGTVLRASGDDLWVATGEGTLCVIEVQAEGKRPMSVRDYLAGHHVVPGERFGPFGS